MIASAAMASAKKLRDQAATTGNQITGVERYEVVAEG